MNHCFSVTVIKYFLKWSVFLGVSVQKNEWHFFTCIYYSQLNWVVMNVTASSHSQPECSNDRHNLGSFTFGLPALLSSLTSKWCLNSLISFSVCTTVNLHLNRALLGHLVPVQLHLVQLLQTQKWSWSFTGGLTHKAMV